MDLKNEIINKSGFLIYTDYWEKYFSKMSGEQIKEVFKIIFCFNKTFEILKTNDLAVEMVVATIIDNIKRDAEKRFKQSIASKENGKMGGRPKLKKNKPIGSNPLNPKPNLDESMINEANSIYKKLSDGLLFILEAKLQRKLSSKNWEDEIKKLIEKDLSVRQNPIEDVKQAIQTISNNYGKEYFPVIQSAKSLKEKFTKIEDYVKRSSQGKNNQSAENDRPKFLSQYQHLLNK
jgi:hypothetical protein